MTEQDSKDDSEGDSVSVTRHKIIFIGRLVKNHKRPHLLIKAFTKLADCFPNWELELWGAESNRTYTKSLQHRIEKSGLQSRIHLKGVTRDVAGVLRDGDIFVLPSAYEGFGLSLAEAMSMGLPVIGYKNCPAVNELIKHEENGLLCEDGADALAEGESYNQKNFGTFKRIDRAPRKGRNPQTREIVDIPASKALKVVVSNALKEKLNH